MLTSRSSSLGDDPGSPKLRKQDAPNSEQLKKKTVTFRNQLSLTGVVEAEAIITELQKLRKEVEGPFEEEEHMLQMERKLDKQTIELINENQRVLMRSSHEAREVEMAAEAKYFELEELIRWLMIKVLDLEESSVSSICGEDVIGAQIELEALKDEIIELKEKSMESQTKFECQNPKLEQATIQESNFGERKAEECMEELDQILGDAEEEKLSVDDVIAALCERLKISEEEKRTGNDVR